MEKIPFLRRHGCNAVFCVLALIMHAQEAGKVAPLAHRFVDRVGYLPGFVPFAHVGLDFGFDPGADFIAEGGVGFVEERRVVL